MDNYAIDILKDEYDRMKEYQYVKATKLVDEVYDIRIKELKEAICKLETSPSFSNVIGVSKLSEEKIRAAAEHWVWIINGAKWSNNDNTAPDNFGSFVAGAKYAIQISEIENNPTAFALVQKCVIIIKNRRRKMNGVTAYKVSISKDSKSNLCDDCCHRIQACENEITVFGNAQGHDNIILCSAYKPRDTKENILTELHLKL